MSHPPYMIQLCQKLFQSDIFERPEDEAILLGICSNWFKQAFNHCSKILTMKPGCTKLWTRIVNLKKLIFQENETSLFSDKIPMSLHPDLLSLANCQELSEKVIQDYIYYIPRYMSLMEENKVLRHILTSILELVVIVICFVIARKWLHKKFNSSIRKTKETVSSLNNEIRSNMKTVLYETKYLSVVHVIDPKLLQIGCPVIGLKISRNQLINIERIWNGTCENHADADITMMQKKLQRFLHQRTVKHLLIISIEFDKIDEDDFESKKSPRTSYIPIHKIENKKGIRRRP